jgi:hypothetical protein
MLLLVSTMLTASMPWMTAGSQPELAITDSGLGTAFHPGDTATGYLVASNTGNVTIQDITVTLMIYPDAMLGFPAACKKQVFSVGLSPGDTRRIEYSQVIPSSVIGISTIGHYRLDAKIEADGSYVTTIQKPVDVV